MTFKLIASVFLITINCFPQETKPDFSGTWAYQAAPFSPANETDRIEQVSSTLKISELVGRADVIYTQEFYTDGRQWKRQTGPNTVIRTAHWDGSLLILETKWINSGVVTTKREELALSDDRKVMIKKIYYSGPEVRPDRTIEFKKISDGIRGIAIGDSESTVRHEWGEPNSVEVEGDQTTFVYAREGPKDLLVIFVSGKMTDSTWRKKQQ
jgi:hypothetical protein